jgi:xyloglucan-specific exo-beta-1,4-glucanase
MRKLFRGLALLLPLFILPGLFHPVDRASGSAAAPYQWDNVAIGGGGYVTGLIIHPITPDLVYARTDVGGTYRWDPEEQSWIQLMNSISYEDKNLYGIDGIAIAPSDDQVLFAAAGMNKGTEPSDVMKSTDRGTTWSRTNLNKSFAGNGNTERSYGESIAVNPNDSNHVLVGTRLHGIWKSENGASRTDGSGSTTDENNWTQATGVPFDTEGRGVRSIVFKDSTTVYAGVIGYGVYESTDGGGSWSLMPDSPVHPRRIQVSLDGSIYVTHSRGVAKYDSDVWSDITPPTSLHLNNSSASTNYNGLTVDPTNPKHLIVARRAGSVPEDMFRSTDGGMSWININTSFQVHHSSPWWNANFLAGAVSSILFDPHVPGRVWMSDWNGIYRTEDVAQPKVVWTTYTKGHEEMVGFDMISPPTGASLLGAYADNDGMRHEDLTQFPLKKFGNPNLSETTALDYVEADPNYMVRVGGYNHGARGSGGTSSDGGRTWVEFPDFPMDGNGVKYPHGNVAVSATDPQLIVTVPINAPPMRSADGGKSWTVASGTPEKVKFSFWNWTQVITSDKIEGNVFYLYYSGKFYRSDDGGAQWSIINADLPTGPAYVKSAPGKSGEVWVSLNTNGLYRTTDGGASFSKIPNVQETLLFGFGKAAPGTNNPAVYVYGKVNGSTRMGIYRSDDSGMTWMRINDDQHLVGGNPRDLEGDRQVYGRVYIAMDGTGVWYGELATPPEQDVSAPSVPSALAVTENEDSTLTLSWSPPSDPDILHYVIYDGDEMIRLASGDATSASITQIQPGKTYNFHIVARDTSWHSSAASEKISVTAGLPLITLGSPSGSTVAGQSFSLTGTVSLPSHVQVKKGDIVVAETDTTVSNANNEFRVDIPLVEGVNEFMLEAVTEKGIRNAVLWRIHVDNIRPVLELKAERKFVNTAEYRLEGTVSKPARILLEVTNNGTIIHSVNSEVYESSFNRMLELKPGANDIRIHAVDEWGNEAAALSESIVYDPHAPAAPSVKAIGISQTSATLSWSAVDDPYGDVNYEVYVNGNLSSHAIRTLNAGYSITITGLNPGTAYSFIVKAIDLAGNTNDSEPVSVTTHSYQGSYTPIFQSLPPVKEQYRYPDLPRGIVPAGSAVRELEAVFDKQSGVATAEIKWNDYEQLISQFGTDYAGHNSIVLKVPVMENASEYVLRLPLEVLTFKEMQAEIIVSTEVGLIRLPAGINLQTKPGKNGPIELRLRAVDKKMLPDELRKKVGARPAIHLQISQNGTPLQLSDSATPIFVSLPHAAVDEREGILEQIGVVAVDENRQVNKVPTGKYDTKAGVITFTANRNGIYAVVLQHSEFEDLALFPWAKKAIEELESRGIIQGTSSTSFSPSNLVTRADFTLMLIRALGITGQAHDGFDDVHPSDYYYEEIRLAKSLGIVLGRGDGGFAPMESITRQEMMVIAARALRAAGKPVAEVNLADLMDVEDMSEVASYAQQEVASLVNAGIIEGSGSGLHPHRQSTRAESAVLIYRLSEAIKK